MVTDSCDRLQNAIAGGLATADYNSSNVLSYICGMRHCISTVIDIVIGSDMVALSNAARVTYLTNSTINLLQHLNTSDLNAVLAGSQPWKLEACDFQPTS